VEIASFVVVFGGVILLFAPWVCRAKRDRQHFTARFTLCTARRSPLEPLGEVAGKCPECRRRFSFEHHRRLLRVSGYRER
jgi:hypothetical protein